MKTWLTLNSELRTKTALRDEYANSIKTGKNYVSVMTMRAFKKERARLTKLIVEIKKQMGKHPDNPKNFKG